jgi:hypothetical protein
MALGKKNVTISSHSAFFLDFEEDLSIVCHCIVIVVSCKAPLPSSIKYYEIFYLLKKRYFMRLKDSAAITYMAKPQIFTISVLNSGAIGILKSLANMKLIKLEASCGNEPNAETKKIIEETDAGIGTAKFKNVKRFMDDLRK